MKVFAKFQKQYYIIQTDVLKYKVMESFGMRYCLFVFGILILLSGCQNFQSPPVATTENLFQTRKRDGADELLKDIKVLTISDAQRIAMINNPDYKSAAYSVNAATMAYYQALGAFSPVISAGFTIGNDHNWVDSAENVTLADYTGKFYTNTKIGANWLIFNGLGRYFSAKAAKAGEKYQQAMEEDSARMLLSGVVYAYNEILLAAANLKISQGDMVFQSNCLKETELKQQVGTVPVSDVLNFKIRVNNAANGMLVAERQYALATYALAVLMGYPDGKLPDWITFDEISIDLDAVIPSVEVYLDTALANRPDLKAMREQLNIYKYNKYTAYSAFSPTISAFANFDYNTTKNNYHNYYNNSSHNNGPGFQYGLSANWTIFNGLIRMNKVREAKANEVVASYRVASSWLKVIQEVREAYTNYVYSVRQSRLYEKTLQYSTEQRDLVTKEYNAGTIGITRLNEVQNDLINAESTLVSAYINSKNARIQLDTAAGIITKGYYKTTDSSVEAVSERIVAIDEQKKSAAVEGQVTDATVAPIAVDTTATPGATVESDKVVPFDANSAPTNTPFPVLPPNPPPATN